MPVRAGELNVAFETTSFCCALPAWWYLRGAQNPIPFRTRPLNSSAPMILRLKTRESRSLPSLPSTALEKSSLRFVPGRRPSGRRFALCAWPVGVWSCRRFAEERPHVVARHRHRARAALHPGVEGRPRGPPPRPGRTSPRDERDGFRQFCRVLGSALHHEHFDDLERVRMPTLTSIRTSLLPPMRRPEPPMRT